MGAPKTADFLEKASWTLIAIIVALSIVAVGVKKSEKANAVEGSVVAAHAQEEVEASQAAQAVPEFEAEATEEVAE